MTGIWLGATYALGRDVPTSQPYPHICGITITGRMTPRLRIYLSRKACAACAEEAFTSKAHPRTTVEKGH